MRVFFDDADYALYRDLLGQHCRAADVEVWAWCLMPNHVHLILVPSDPDGLRRALAALHRRYAGVVHARPKRAGHFWQGRFGAAVMDKEHLAAALRYVNSDDRRRKADDGRQKMPKLLVRRPSTVVRQKENRALAGPVQSVGVGAPTTPSRGEQLPAFRLPIWEDSGNRLPCSR